MKAPKLTARQFLAKFPKSAPEPNDGCGSCIEDMGCPECGHRDYFRIEIKTLATFDWEGTCDEGGDKEWNRNSYCECVGCGHAGNVRDFTFKGLDELYNPQPKSSPKHLNPKSKIQNPKSGVPPPRSPLRQMLD